MMWRFGNASSSLMRSSTGSALVTSKMPAASKAAAAAGGKFRSRATAVDPFNFKSNHVPAWQPSAKYMQYRAVRYLVENAMAIATYQLALEAGLTALFGMLIYMQYTTFERVLATLQGWRYPFVSWVGTVEDCEVKEPVDVAGVVSLKPEKLSALYAGHNIASGLLPVQVLVLAMTFPSVLRASRAVTAMWKGTAAAAPAAASVAKDAAATAAASSTKVAAAQKPYVRRPAYARPPSNPTRQ